MSGGMESMHEDEPRTLNFAQRLHETQYRLPRGAAQTVLLWTVRPEWHDGHGLKEYVDAMNPEEVKVALIALIECVAKA
jgi:hypothetical protein